MDKSEQSTNDNFICNPLDMSSTDFNSDLYMSKLLRESRLSELMDTEQMLYKQIQTLDSEMQTLIYENYNKFISATDTVRKMSSHFDKMEHELNLLSKNMELITDKSNEIATNISGNREDLTKMSTTHFLLNKIQFILELPTKMQELTEQNMLIEAVNDYLKAKYALDLYSHFSSIKNIQIECSNLLDQIKERLYENLSNEESSSINESIEYLIKLNENPVNLCDKYFEMCTKKLDHTLESVNSQIESELQNMSNMDILEFVDNVCDKYLGCLNQCIVFYADTFLNKSNLKVSNQIHNQMETKLKIFVDYRMDKLFDIILKRIKLERTLPHNIIMFVRALDRFYNRVKKLNKTFSLSDYSEKGLDIVYQSANDQCEFMRSHLYSKYQDELSTVRHDTINKISKASSIARSANLNSSSIRDNNKINSLSEIIIGFETVICENLKSTLICLNPFLDIELAFSKKDFKDKFVNKCAFESVVVEYVELVLQSAIEYETTYTTAHIPSQLILILSKICLDMSNSIISYLFNFTEELFNIPLSKKSLANSIAKKARDYAQRLLNIYVWIEGQSISNMIRKSVETRDWLSSVEPRSVRSVMKRVIEDITLIDYHVGQLYEEGVRIERSSDSGRTFSTFSYNKSHRPNSSWSYSANSFDNNIISNIQKLFNDKIEIFGKIEFSKLSVVTGVIKIGLKTLIECVRLCTFSRFGLQQMQVDSYYLQIHLWKFASDEKIIANLIDEVITSVKKRCLEPTGMERSVIENICENV